MRPRVAELPGAGVGQPPGAGGTGELSNRLLDNCRGVTSARRRTRRRSPAAIELLHGGVEVVLVDDEQAGHRLRRKDAGVIGMGGRVIGMDGRVIGMDAGVIAMDAGVIGTDGRVIGMGAGVIAGDAGVIGMDGRVIRMDGRVIAVDAGVIGTDAGLIPTHPRSTGRRR